MVFIVRQIYDLCVERTLTLVLNVIIVSYYGFCVLCLGI